MRNNDFEFIKDKFESAQLDVPHSLDGDVMEKKIMAKTEHKKIKFRKKHKFLKNLTAVAACFIIIAGAVFAYNAGYFDTNRVTGFDNYNELNAKLSTLEKINTPSEMGGGYFSTKLYIAEDGVENPKTVKYYNGHLFYAYYNSNENNNRNKVYIFNAKGENSNLIALINDLNLDDFEIQDLFAQNNRLIINLTSEKSVITKIYDITNCADPIFISEFKQSGKYSSSNIIGNKLFVFTSHIDSNNLPYIEDNGERKTASYENIVCFENATVAQYAVINSIDIEKGTQTDDLKAFLGGSSKVRCTKDYIYINEYIEGEIFDVPEREVTTAMKMNVENGKVAYATEEEIKQYSNIYMDVGRGEDAYSSTIYQVGEYFISIGDNFSIPETEIILFDKNFNEIDNLIFEFYDFDLSISTMYGSLAVNEENDTFAISAYFPNETSRIYGVLTFAVENNKIVIKDKYMNEDENAMYEGMCIFAGDYLYSFNINDYAEDSEKVKIFSYNYE